MSRSPDYDAEAADLVARTLRAVAADTKVAGHDALASPVARLAAPTDLTGRRSRRLPRTLVASAAAAAVLVAALVWAGSEASDPSDTTSLGTPAEGAGRAPAEVQPGRLPDGLKPLSDLLADNGVLYDTEAFLMEPPDGGEILAVVVNWPDAGVSDADELTRIAQALATPIGAETGPAEVTAPPGESVGYITLPIGDVNEDDVSTVNDMLREQGIGVQQLGSAYGWLGHAVDVSWVPGVAPTVGRRYADDGSTLDVYTAFGDIAGAMDMTRLMSDATPYPVNGNMGWQTTTRAGGSMVVWQAAPGTVAAIVAGEDVADDIPAVIESIPAPEPKPGEHPNWRLVERSEEGDVPWVVEAGDFVPGIAERPCMSLWVAGQVPVQACSLAQMPADLTDSFGPLTQVDDDITVVFGLFAPTVASVETEAARAEHARVEAQPFDPADPMSQRYAVMIVHGGRGEPQTFRLLDAQGEVLDTRSFNLNEVGG
jgi:hypothetical protein